MINWKRFGPSPTSLPDRFSWADMPEELPVDVMPCSNEEYLPEEPTRAQRAIMEIAGAEVERLRTKYNMSRRQFVRTAAATTVGFWAIDLVRMGRFGNYGWAHNTATTAACDLEWDGRGGLATLRNLPGEFIFDVQSHHVDPDGLWRVTNPVIHAFFSAVWPQARQGGELDPIENLSRFHYLKEIFLDSATTMSVLSCVPTSPDANNPLPLAEAARTVETVNDLANSRRTIMHAFVMPNRGAPLGDNAPSIPPPYLDEELELMMTRAKQYRHILRGWKTYCAWGSVPGASGWWLDSDTGMAFLDQVRAVNKRFPQIPKLVATHKGFALPGFDQEKSTPRDIGPAAKAYRDVKFLVYHSGFDIGDTPQRPYAGDANVSSSTNQVDALIKSLRENNYDARRFRKPGHKFGNVPNVYAELGSVWRNVMNDPDSAAHTLGKLITHVGPKRVIWGTDSLWYGSPQAEIVGLRRFQFTEEGREMYGLPFGLEGDVEDPTRKAPRPERTIRNGILGRNAARAYGVDPDRRRRKIHCDDVQALREDGYLRGTAGEADESAPLAMNVAPGPRTRREVLHSLKNNPWAP